MDVKQVIYDHLRIRPGRRYTPEGLTREINDAMEVNIQLNPQEVKKHCLEIAESRDKVNHYSSVQADSVVIDGRPRTLYSDDDYLRYDVVAEHAPDRIDQVEDLFGEELRKWIVDELADETEGSNIRHTFEFEERGWGGPD